MKVIIAGSRSITEYKHVLRAVVKSGIDVDEIDEVVSGTAGGVDRLGERFARDQFLKIVRFPADWRTYGKRAGFLRNKQMADYADYLIAVWDGESRGAESMINLMMERGKKYYVHKVDISK